MFSRCCFNSGLLFAFLFLAGWQVPSVHGELISSFHGAFQLSSPFPGWSYLWNANGPIGDPANYLPLVANSVGSYTTDGAAVRPAPAPGNFLSISSQIGQPGGHPGMGALQSGSGGIERYCIAAYSLTAPQRIVLQNGLLRNINSNDRGSTDGLNLKIFANDDPNPLLSKETAPGFDQFTEFSLAIGDLMAGDMIYVAIGSRDSDLFDGFNLRYDIVAVPEPSTIVLVVAGLVLLVTQRVKPFSGEITLQLVRASRTAAATRESRGSRMRLPA